MNEPEIPRPRLAPEMMQQAMREIIACQDAATAEKIAERLWSLLRGDMQDRITSLIYAVKGAVEAEDIERRREALRRELRLLDGKEAAATYGRPSKPPARANKLPAGP